MSEVTASSDVSPSYVSPPSGAGIAAAAKLVVEGIATVLEQRALAHRAASDAALSRRNVAALRAMYVGKA
ncbi:MAG TPA: hypothetical protein VGP14_11615 [Casimicrobiaceae bacterium]|nr:hypothetical protein [Casimicrobiaceae bacterium]